MPAGTAENTAHETETIRVCEDFAGTLASEGNVIRGVKLLGLTSKNGRTYPPAVIRRAVGLYEGIKVNLDHPAGNDPSAPRKVADRFGIIRAAKFVEGQGVVGNLSFNPKHSLAEQVKWAAENEPGLLGFSHNAVLRMGATKNGSKQVESIEGVRSVDLVADPATTGGFYEHQTGEGREDTDQSTKGGSATAANGSARKPTDPTGRARDVKDLPDSAFAHIEPGGKKDAQGRTTPRSKRVWPLHTSDSIRAALASIPRRKGIDAKTRDQALGRARAAARRMKIKTESLNSEADMDLADLTIEELRTQRPDLADELAADKKATEELESLRKENEQLKAKAAAAEHEKAISEELKAAGLDATDEKQCSKLFLESLQGTEKPEQRKAIIEDRKALLEHAGALKKPAGNAGKPVSFPKTSDAMEQVAPDEFVRNLRRRAA